MTLSPALRITLSWIALAALGAALLWLLGPVLTPFIIAAVLVIYGVGQLLESFVLTPYLVGERIGMNPLAVIFALLAFGHLFGFIGVLVALPVGAVAVVALRCLRAVYVDSPLYSG
jgi:predicted PurR-regulated permease PerM